MKKTIRLAVLLLTLATCVVGFTACSNKSNDRFGIIEDEASGLTFMLDEETESYRVVNCDEWRTEIVIPSEFNRRSVTAIGNSAFKECSSLTSVVIPDSVTSIGVGAFYECTSLTSVTIGDSVTSIGVDAFSGCSSLTSVVIPDSVTSIGDYAFSGCSSLQYNEYDNALYLGNATNKYIYLAKAKSTDITGCIINENCKLIGYSAFNNCSNLTSVTIGNSVTSIEGSAFYNCSNLTSIEIPNNVTSIGERAFEHCASLTSVTIPDCVTSIGDGVFVECYKLVEVINKSSLNITKGSDDNGYVGYYALKVKTSGESEIVNKDGYLFYTYNNVNYLLGYVGNETNLTLPDSYNEKGYEIYQYAFTYCGSLTSIVIPDCVTTIGEWAFFRCSSLTSVTIPNNVTSIGYMAFDGCDSLQYNEYENALYLGNATNKYLYLAKAKSTDITVCIINENCKFIGSCAFEFCTSLTSIEIPNNVTSIGYSAFYDCDNIQYNEYDNALYLGNATNKYLYLAKAKSKDITGCIINENCKFIGYSAFSWHTRLTSIVIPDSVTSIEEGAFRNCWSLTSIVIPDNVESIGNSAFEGCDSLTSVTIGSGVMSIGSDAFEGCDSLTSVYYTGTTDEWVQISFGNDYSNPLYYAKKLYIQ